MIKVPCEIWSRCVGYYRPKSQFNPGKQSEFADRKTVSNSFFNSLNLKQEKLNESETS